MIIMLIYIVCSMGLAYGFFKLRTKYIQRKNVNQVRWPWLLSIINFVLLVLITIWFILEPSSFKTEKDMSWNFWTIIMTCISLYFYVLAVPISMTSYLMLRDKREKKVLRFAKFLNLFNSFAYIIVIYLILSSIS